MTVTHTRIVDAVSYFSECPVENSVPFIFSRIFLYVARVTPKARMSKVTIMTGDCYQGATATTINVRTIPHDENTTDVHSTNPKTTAISMSRSKNGSQSNNMCTVAHIMNSANEFFLISPGVFLIETTLRTILDLERLETLFIRRTTAGLQKLKTLFILARRFKYYKVWNRIQTISTFLDTVEAAFCWDLSDVPYSSQPLIFNTNRHLQS